MGQQTTSYQEREANGEGIVSDSQITIGFSNDDSAPEGALRVLSLFSGCGGMDIGFEGGFIAHSKSLGKKKHDIAEIISDCWVRLRRNSFYTVFANDILPEAEVAWTEYMRHHGHSPGEYHLNSIVDLVKMHKAGVKIFPDNVDVVTGGFPCQDFSVAGKRRGFESQKDHEGNVRSASVPTEESRGKLYYWMKQVIDITKSKVFIAENVKGLVSLGDVKAVIQRDFASAGSDGYIVLNPRVLHAGDYGVPESRERVIFIGIRTEGLRPEAYKALTQPDIADEYNPYPHPTHRCTVNDDTLPSVITCNDVLSMLPEPEQSGDLAHSIYSHAKYQGNGSQGQTEIKLDGLGPTIRSEHHGNIEFRRLSAEHGGKHTEELTRGLQERRLSPRECALIQTFPPDYDFVIPKTAGRGYRVSSSGAYKIIGNAVPPMLAYNIARRLEEVWPLYFNE
ncbi:MAG TPA: DNA (cytosine-5-)-methyltransferase [Prevotellaceae bacterium]|nr:DNA (cytosine-5-)-methyltransferase [Prevotellaceae bacterium]